MNDRITAFVNVRVTVASPDRSVRTTFSRREGFGIELDSRRAGGHTETSLARQVTLAISGVRAGYQEAVRRVMPQSPIAEVAPEPARERHRERRRLACAEIAVQATSPRRYAKVRITGAGEVTCKIRPEALTRNRVDLHELADDIRQAYQHAQTSHRHQVREADEFIIQRYLRDGKSD